AVVVTGGLTADGTITLISGGNGQAYLRFDTSEVLGGTGKVNFANTNRNVLWLPNSGTTLTLGPRVTGRRASGPIGSGASVALGGATDVAVVNEGTITANAGGTITIAGNGYTDPVTQLPVPGFTNALSASDPQTGLPIRGAVGVTSGALTIASTSWA